MKISQSRLRLVERVLSISQELVANPSRDDVLHHIVQVAAEWADCDTAGLLLFDEASQTLQFIAVAQYMDQIFDIPVPIEGSIAGVAFLTGEPVLVENAIQDPRHYTKVDELLNYPAHSLLAVPLIFRGRTIGVLEAENKNNNQIFTQDDARLMTILAAQAAIAIENARLLEQFRHMAQAEQQERQAVEALQRASAALISTLKYDEVVDRILEQVSQVVPGDTNNVMIIEKGNLARIFRGRGYDRFGTAETLSETTMNISTVPGLRRMLETQQPILIPDVTRDPNWVISRPEHRWIRSYIGVPIVINQVVVGFLNVMNAIPGTYNQTHIEHLLAFASHAAIAIENARLYRQAQDEISERSRVEEELRRHQEQLEELIKERTAEVHHLAITDPLTELFNRRHILNLGNQALRQARRIKQPLSAMMIDIDHFKKINDTYGHVVGDEALQLLSAHMRNEMRATDILGRYGGEEFIALMPNTSLNLAMEIAERLLSNLRKLRINTKYTEINLTASIGVVCFDPEMPTNLDMLILLADQAMYLAKNSGRNQVRTLLDYETR